MLCCWKGSVLLAGKPSFYWHSPLWEIKLEATRVLINNRGNFMGHPGSVNKDGKWIIRDVIILMPAALSKTLLVNLIITQSAAELRLHMLPAAPKCSHISIPGSSISSPSVAFRMSQNIMQRYKIAVWDEVHAHSHTGMHIDTHTDTVPLC